MSRVAFVLGLHESGRAPFPFSVHKVSLLLTALCCCGAGDSLERGPHTRGRCALAQSLSYRDTVATLVL